MGRGISDKCLAVGSASPKCISGQAYLDHRKYVSVREKGEVGAMCELTD